MKKKLIILGSVEMMAVATVFALGSMESGAANSLELRNIEALSSGENTTSWNCDGSGGMCKTKCGVCESMARGTGKLTGEHSCR